MAEFQIDPALQAAVGGIILFVVQYLKKIKFLQNSQWYALASVITGGVIAVGYAGLYRPGWANIDMAIGIKVAMQGGIMGIFASGLYSVVKNTLGR